MSVTIKKRAENKKPNSKWRNSIISFLRSILSFTRGLIGKYYLPAALLTLIIVILFGDLLTKNGILLLFGILFFILLHYFVKWLDTH